VRIDIGGQIVTAAITNESVDGPRSNCLRSHQSERRDGRGRLIMGRAALMSLVLITLLDAASAAEDGCKKFAWSITRELAWFAASDKTSVTAGETVAGFSERAVVIRLQPAAQASFELPPERKPKTDQWFGGTVRFPAIEKAGIYQITLSDEAWVDIVQDGRYARSVGSSGRGDCPGLRKTVRLEMAPVPFAVQISGVSSDAITIAISPAE